MSDRIYAKVADKHFQGLPEFVGHHVWAYVAVFTTNNPGDRHPILDKDNLMTIEGPGCIHCGAVFSLEVVANRCPGIIGADHELPH